MLNVDVVSSVAMVGLGGIGKTTLSQMVCNDPMVKAFFQKQIWIHVSHSFDVQAIFIWRSFITSSTRYLLVLDDVWNLTCQNWNQLTTFFMSGAAARGIFS